MSVCNCRVKYIRPKYKNLKEWIQDPENVYIGRSGIVFIDNERYPKDTSVFCNPFKINKNTTRDQVISTYREYIIDKIDHNLEIKEQLMKMKNKNLGCWCYPEACHGNVLLELIEMYSDIH